MKIVYVTRDVTIRKDEFVAMQNKLELLHALQEGGVDSWEGYELAAELVQEEWRVANEGYSTTESQA